MELPQEVDHIVLALIRIDGVLPQNGFADGADGLRLLQLLPDDRANLIQSEVSALVKMQDHRFIAERGRNLGIRCHDNRIARDIHAGNHGQLNEQSDCTQVGFCCQSGEAR